MRRFILITFSLILFCAGIFIVIDEGFSVQGLMTTLFFGLCTVIAIFEDQMNDWVIKKRDEKAKAGFCRFDEEAIIFPKGYYFKHGFLGDKKALNYQIIDEIRINTHPISAKITGNEIIFLVGATKEDCLKIAEKHKIPVVNPIDIWSLICDEFLDTEYDGSDKRKTIEMLKKAGISERETEEIRKRISSKMLAHTYVSMEWVYYGQYDVLIQLFPLSKENYWWTMEIALRNDKTEMRDRK